MDAHMHRQVMPIVERLAAGNYWANKICSQLVIGQVSLEMPSRAEFFLARFIGAPKDLAWVLGLLFLSSLLLTSEALAWSTEAEQVDLIFGLRHWHFISGDNC